MAVDSGEPDAWRHARPVRRAGRGNTPGDKPGSAPRPDPYFELETSGGGTWRSGDVVDYWAKLVLAGPVTATQTHRDAIASAGAAIAQAEQLLDGR